MAGALVLLAAGATLWRSEGVGPPPDAPSPPPGVRFLDGRQGQGASGPSVRRANSAVEAKLMEFEILFRHSNPASDPVTCRRLENLAASPTQCVAIGRRLMTEYPQYASDCGAILIGALLRADAHQAALELASFGSETDRADWLASIYPHWIARAGDRAAEIADQVRQFAPPAFAATVVSWASVDPQAVAGYATKLPVGEQRQAVLSAGLNAWVLRDPLAVLEWIQHLSDSEEFDYALSSVVVRSDALVMPARLAADFASSIEDPQLRAIVMRRVLSGWLDDPLRSETRDGGSTRAFTPDGR